MYADRNWGLIEDHINLALVRFSFELNNLDDAVMFVKRLIMHNSLPFYAQNSVLRQFLFIMKVPTVTLQ